MPFAEQQPPLPPPNVQLTDKDGRPTEAFVTYLNKLAAWLQRLANST